MVIDTMVFVYALLNVDGKCDEATRILAQANTIIVPDSFRAELANVTWQWVKHRNVPEAIAHEVLQDSDSLIDQVVGSEKIWARALQLSIQHDHPVYDTLFVATAEMLNDWVVTYDAKMQLKFPHKVMAPTDFFASSENQ